MIIYSPYNFSFHSKFRFPLPLKILPKVFFSKDGFPQMKCSFTSLLKNRKKWHIKIFFNDHVLHDFICRRLRDSAKRCHDNVLGNLLRHCENTIEGLRALSRTLKTDEINGICIERNGDVYARMMEQCLRQNGITNQSCRDVRNRK